MSMTNVESCFSSAETLFVFMKSFFRISANVCKTLKLTYILAGLLVVARFRCLKRRQKRLNTFHSTSKKDLKNEKRYPANFF